MRTKICGIKALFFSLYYVILDFELGLNPSRHFIDCEFLLNFFNGGNFYGYYAELQ